MSTCATTYRAAHDSGERARSSIELVVLHCTQGTTAQGAAAWFANRASAGSAHVVVDAKECFRTLNDLRIAWAAPGANHNGLHLEFAGFAQWKRVQWLRPSYRRALKRGARITAQWLKEYGLPAEIVTTEELRRGAHGITRHVDVSQAFHQSTHWDPGPNFPMRFFLRLVRKQLRRLR